jgi:hypothetical protein
LDLEGEKKSGCVMYIVVFEISGIFVKVIQEREKILVHGAGFGLGITNVFCLPRAWEWKFQQNLRFYRRCFALSICMNV